jgi:hypothetical protein
MDFGHAEGCEARNEDNEDEIDGNPLEYLDGCDCGLHFVKKVMDIANRTLSVQHGKI